MFLKFKGFLIILVSCGFEFVYDVVSGDIYIGYFIGWLYIELIMFFNVCLVFWIELCFGFLFLRKISFWSCFVYKFWIYLWLIYKVRGKNSIELFDF